MNKQAPSTGRLLTMVAFAASCSGCSCSCGSRSAAARRSARAVTRSARSSTRRPSSAARPTCEISGVDVGKVISVGLDRRTGLTRAVMEIDPQFAPRPGRHPRDPAPEDAAGGDLHRAFAWIGERAPSSPTARRCRGDRSRRPSSSIRSSRPSTPPPAGRSRPGCSRTGSRSPNRGQDLNAALAELYPFATNVDSVLAVLNRDSAATSTLLNDGGQVFSAIAHSPAALQQLIVNADGAFSATAAQSTALAADDQAFPPFLLADARRRSTAWRASRGRPSRSSTSSVRPPSSCPGASVARRPRPRAEEPARQRRTADARLQGRRARARELPQRQRPAAHARLTPYLGGLIPVIDYINDLPARGRRLLRQRNRRPRGATLPANGGHGLLHYVRIANPINPETLTRLFGPPCEQPRQPVSGPRRLHRCFRRASGVRELPVHEQSSAGDWPYYFRLCWLTVLSCRAVLLHVGPQRPALQGAAAARRSRPPDRQKHSPNYNQPHEHGRLCLQQRTKRRSHVATIVVIATALAVLIAAASAFAATAASIPTPPRSSSRPIRRGRRRGPSAIGFTQKYIALGDQRRPDRAADRHQDHDLRAEVGRQGLPDV